MVNREGREQGAARVAPPGPAQLEAFDACLDAVVRARADGEVEKDLSKRLLQRIANAPDARLERRASLRLLWLSGISGAFAFAAMAAFSYSHVRDGAPLPSPRSDAGSAAHTPTLSVPGKGSKPVLQAGMFVGPNSYVLRVHAQPHALVAANVESSAMTREDATLPKLETFPARTPSVAEREHSIAVPDAPTMQVVIVPGPSFETAELHIEPIPTEALPSNKDPD